MAETTDAIQQELAKYDPSKYHILLPKSVASQACGLTVPRIAIVELNPNPEAGDVYPVGGRDEGDEGDDTQRGPKKYGFGKPACMRFANAAQISWDAAESKILSVSADYVAYKAVAYMRGADGTRIEGYATKDIDMRVVEAEIRERKQRTNRSKKKNWSPEWIEQMVQSELIQWRKNKLMRAETGAQERVIKALLAMRPAYTMNDLALPFLLVRFDINFNHPEIKKMFAAQGSLAAQALYGGRGAKMFVGSTATVIDADAVVPDEEEAEPTFASSEPAPATASPATAPEPPGTTTTEPQQPAPPQTSPTNPGVPAKPAGTESAPETKAAAGECAECHKPVTEGVAKYSQGKFNRVLCFNCQKNAGGAQK